MEFVRFDAAKAAALPGGANAVFMPVQRGEVMVGMIVQLEKKGDTGKRQVPLDVLLTVVEGEGRIRSGGEIADLKAGDVALLPGGMLHEIWTSDSRIQFVMMDVGSTQP